MYDCMKKNDINVKIIVCYDENYNNSHLKYI